MQEAMFYERIAENRVRCHLCAHHCVIADGKKGVCRVRENRGGILYPI
jgi:pyruvate formate lyase activating enzyme